ncbi:hypothetical protein OROGR_009228 [Orobanche gracilis]
MSKIEQFAMWGKSRKLSGIVIQEPGNQFPSGFENESQELACEELHENIYYGSQTPNSEEETDSRRFRRVPNRQLQHIDEEMDQEIGSFVNSNIRHV